MEKIKRDYHASPRVEKKSQENERCVSAKKESKIIVLQSKKN